ncbi:hypothetical protein AB835_07435 [Candidatus Endobugula sertula]|uniref:Uncharacterized protein n=1 Tax=Candidatus Endobugula sertula TaxID=62101 RepID=A0A1D2QQ70_9GAMM|nr:hypothetical protein AB835_07435 [Candidatus Endobugula sertula]
MTTTQTIRNLYQTHADTLSSWGYSSLVDIAQQSFDTFHQTCRKQLSVSQTRALYCAAQQHVQHLQAYHRKLLSHANPQLQSIPHLAIDPMSEAVGGYETEFGQRADVYVPKESVASVFSPAAYLTELYREGSQLHQEDKPQHLNQRRPDLQSLPLSQSNMDTTISSLALSNNILRSSLNEADLDENLSNQLYPFDLPYHAPFSGIEAAFSAQNTDVETIAEQLAATRQTDNAAKVIHSAFSNHLSPVLVEALLEPIATDATELNAQLQQHFGAGVSAVQLADVDTFCNHTGISRNELNAYLSLPSFRESCNTQLQASSVQVKDSIQENLITTPGQYGGQYLNATSKQWLGFADQCIARVTIEAPESVTDRVAILPSINDRCITFAALAVMQEGQPSTYIDIKLDDEHITAGQPDTFSSEDGTVCSLPLINGYRTIEYHAQAGTDSYKLVIGVGDEDICNPGAWYPDTDPSEDNFTLTFSTASSSDLIKLSKFIRYCQHTGLSSSTLDVLIRLSNMTSVCSINTQTLLLTALVLNYQACYHINEDDAVVLAGGNINVYAEEGQLSQFDRLFNNPPLNGQAFTTDDVDNTINFDPDDEVYSTQRAVLKRAFGVDDTGLGVLAALCDHDSLSYARSLARISDLYRVAQWANLHQLTPQELQYILILNNKTEAVHGQLIGTLMEYRQVVYTTCQWLKAQHLSVSTVYAMTTSHYLTTLTPEMDALLRTLYQSVDDETLLKQSFAPHLAGALSLSGVDQALVVQDWIDAIAAEQALALTSIDLFWQEIVACYDNDDSTTGDTEKLAAFCQALAQLSLIIHTWQLSTVELALLVYTPSTLQDGQTILSLTLDNLQAIANFKTLQQAAGEQASELLTALDHDSLSIDLLAQYLAQPADELTQAATAIGLDTATMLTATQASYLDLWLQTANNLGVSVSVVDSLLSQSLRADYTSWQTLDGNIQAGLSETPGLTVKRSLDESLSTALCAYYLNSFQAESLRGNGIPLQNRDELFQYLLIDNQVSAEIDTTLLAEAISSIQLYINRCLQGLEANVDKPQQLDTFFVEWDQYNKRYSTWAGASQLAYYPENYIDPTLRYNQTNLQRALLDEISQSKLSSDSVEVAYLNYLNNFEDIANLKVLSGYHHAATMDQGSSYFIGRTNTEPYRYFWRSLNHEADDGLGGYVASAWTGWEEINTPINPVLNQVRPVIFNNRLYIGWVELRSRPKTNDDGEVVSTIDEYILQLAYRKINGNWNPAVGFALLNIPAALIPASGPIFNLYLSYHPLQNAILAMLYDPTGEDGGVGYDSVGDLDPWTGGFINSGMQYNPIPVDSDDDSKVRDVFSLFYRNLNGPSTPNKIIRYINAVSYSVTTTPGTAIDTTDESLNVSDVDIVSEEVDNLSVPAVLTYNAQATFTLTNSSSPEAILQQGNPTDNSGDSFDVISCTVDASIRKIFGEFYAIYEMAIDIKTRNTVDGYISTDSGVESSTTGRSDLTIKQFDFIHKESTSKDVEVTISYADSQILFSKYKYITVKNSKSKNVIYNAKMVSDPFNISFTEKDPAEIEPGKIRYDIEYLDYNYSGKYEFNQIYLNVEKGPVAKWITISAEAPVGAIEDQIISTAPENDYINTIPLMLPVVEQGLSFDCLIEVADESGAAWSCVYTLGNTAYIVPGTITYDWGEGPESLTQSGTVPTSKFYRYDIPVGGLKQTRTLIVKQGNVEVFKQSFDISATQNEAIETNPADYFQVVEDNSQQTLYLEDNNRPRRTRLNTLFANELIQRANSSLDNVLNWETQQLPEPKLGNGGYVDLVFDLYNVDTHGNETWYRVYQYQAEADVDNILIAEGNLSVDVEVSQRVYLPYTGRGTWPTILHLRFEFAKGMLLPDQTQRFSYEETTDILTPYSDDNTSNEGRTPGLKQSSVVSTTTEPMDFSGANGLYFWELFYYTPMLVTEKLLQAQNFEEAESWLQYVFNPQGYIEGSYPTAHHVDRQWNVRPLEEDTAWDESQTDSTDPDIVAQGDPMHYKVATYMKLLDLLIARGDMAYRLLEPDTLAEAKMWYVTALNLLGTEPDLPLAGNWSNPTLGVAASTVLQTQCLQSLERVSHAPVMQLSEATNAPQVYTANSLTALFLPSENEKLNGYWQILDQRLFNLRHHLSIDGQPLTLPLYASSADPKALQSAAAAASATGGASLPNVSIVIQRFPVMLESARNLVAQLVQYGGTLQSALAQKDAEALNTLMLTQAQNLLQLNIKQQDKYIEQLQAEQDSLAVTLSRAQASLQTYQAWLDEGISHSEQSCIDIRIAAGSLTVSANASKMAGASLDMAPNIFGLAAGGMQFGAILNATGYGLDGTAVANTTAAEAKETSEQYRRRTQEWESNRDDAQLAVEEIKAKQAALQVQQQAADMQKTILETQQQQGQEQLDFLQTKFSNEALYSWMQGKLSSLFYQFYDLAVARCMQAQLGYQWETKDTATFIQPGAWDDNHAGLLCGEALMLNLAQMETAYLDWDSNALEVRRTVSMAQAMGEELADSSFNAQVNEVLTSGTAFGSIHTLFIATDQTSLIATIDLSALNINADYPDSVVGTDKVRRIKQVSVSLPVLLGPYQDIQALLSYSGSGGGIHQSCTSAAISHGINDSGQFQLDFNNSKYLAFEGLPIDGDGSASLTLTFPNATEQYKQNHLLQSLNDIILHISYTIR